MARFTGGDPQSQRVAARIKLALAVAGIMLAGCNGGIRWQGPTYQDAYALARDANRLIFVYFRSWYLVECTDFEENVLKTPEVVAETRDMVCVPLDFDWDRPLARQWGIKAVPAFVILAPDGRVLTQQQTPIRRQDLIQAIRSAKSAFAPTTRPATSLPAAQP